MTARFLIVFPERRDGMDKISGTLVSHMSRTLRDFNHIFHIEDFAYYYDYTNALNFQRTFVKDALVKKLLRELLEGAQPWDLTCTSDTHSPTVALQSEQSQIAGTYTITCDVQRVSMEIVRLDLQAMHQWISEHRNPQREYLWNPKHGEYGKHIIHKKGEFVSPLLSGRDEAAALLPYAIGLKRWSKLYIFDSAENHYEEFMPGSGNYHSYHLMDDGLVPKTILLNLKMLNKAR